MDFKCIIWGNSGQSGELQVIQEEYHHFSESKLNLFIKKKKQEGLRHIYAGNRKTLDPKLYFYFLTRRSKEDRVIMFKDRLEFRCGRPCYKY